MPGNISVLKHTATIFLLLSLLAQTFRSAVIVGGYYTDTAAYAKNCINKNRPQLHCNGKCQMMKKLKQEEKKEQQNPERRGNGKEESLSSKSFFASVSNLVVIVPALFCNHPTGMPVDRSIAFFHPPGA